MDFTAAWILYHLYFKYSKPALGACFLLDLFLSTGTTMIIIMEVISFSG